MTHDVRVLALQKAGDDFAAMPVAVKANAQRAIERYDKALEIGPALEAAWIGKAKALSRLKRWKTAKECLERALALNPKNAETWLLKGECEEKAGLKSQAEASFSERAKSGNASFRPTNPPKSSSLFIGIFVIFLFPSFNKLLLSFLSIKSSNTRFSE